MEQICVFYQNEDIFEEMKKGLEPDPTLFSLPPVQQWLFSYIRDSMTLCWVYFAVSTTVLQTWIFTGMYCTSVCSLQLCMTLCVLECLWAQWDYALVWLVLTEVVALIWRHGIIKPELQALKYSFHLHNMLLLQLSYCPIGLCGWCVHVCGWNCSTCLSQVIPMAKKERAGKGQIDGSASSLFRALSPTCVGLFLISLACVCVCLCVGEDLCHPSQ